MRKFSFRAWTFPLALLALCVLSYGTLITRLGFYWDDWTAVWYIHFLGPSSFKAAYAVDRPLLAWVVMLTTSLFGGLSPLIWQVFAIFTRWLFGLALWGTLAGLWPRKIEPVAAVAFLFVVYPGFNQQFIAITYGNAFIVSAIFVASLGMMLWAFRKPKWFWPLYILSIVSSGYALFTVEYYFGLEFLRPVLLWMILSESIPEVSKRLRQVFLTWLPYLLMVAFFIFWRATHPTPRAQITIFERLRAAPLAALLELGRTIFKNLVDVTALAWKQTLNFQVILNYETVTILKYAIIILVTASLSIFYLARLRVSSTDTPGITASKSRRLWAFKAILLGIYALLIGGLPIWVTNLRMDLFFPWDRFTLAMMFGASLLVVGLIEAITWKQWQSAVLVGTLVGLAVGMHYQSALNYRKEWLSVKNFFWQLTWRAPAIQPGTVLLTSELPFLYDWDNSLTAPLNWTYAPQNPKAEFPYLLYNVESRFSSGQPELTKDTRINEMYRIVPFTGSPSQAVLVFYQPPACLKVIDPAIDQRLPDKPAYFRDVVQFSNPHLIHSETNSPAKPPAPIFGTEPAHDWCYFFEKADLASQEGDWQQVVALGDQVLAQDKNIYKKNIVELVPFIRGYAHTGNWDKAEQLSMEAYKTWGNTRLMLCDVWKDLHQASPEDTTGEQTFQRVTQSLQCTTS